MEIQYGTITKVTTYVDSKPTDVKEIPEVRVKVVNEQEVLTEFMKFRDETRDMRKAQFRVEHTEAAEKAGHYYIVKTWAELYTKP